MNNAESSAFRITIGDSEAGYRINMRHVLTSNPHITASSILVALSSRTLLSLTEDSQTLGVDAPAFAGAMENAANAGFSDFVLFEGAVEGSFEPDTTEPELTLSINPFTLEQTLGARVHIPWASTKRWTASLAVDHTGRDLTLDGSSQPFAEYILLLIAICRTADVATIDDVTQVGQIMKYLLAEKTRKSITDVILNPYRAMALGYCFVDLSRPGGTVSLGHRSQVFLNVHGMHRVPLNKAAAIAEKLFSLTPAARSEIATICGADPGANGQASGHEKLRLIKTHETISMLMQEFCDMMQFSLEFQLSYADLHNPRRVAAARGNLRRNLVSRAAE